MPIESSDEDAGASRAVANNLRDINEQLVISSIREQERSEESQAERKKLSAVLDTLTEGVIIVEGKTRLLLLNDAARGLFGFGRHVAISSESLAALDIRALDMTPLLPIDRPLARSLRGETVTDSETLLVLSDLGIRHLTSSCTSTMGSNGAALTIVVIRDITERRRLEESVAHSSRLAAIGTLAAGIAHEINNPLTFVMTNVQLVLEQLRAAAFVATPEALLALEAMLLDARQGTERIEKIVAGLGTFSREPTAPRRAVDLRSVMDVSIKLASNEFRHRAKLVKVYGAVPLVEADPVLLGQVFVTLLVNAAHALPERDTAKNEIRVVTSTDSTGRAVVQIFDSGGDISESDLPHIFEPFFTTKFFGHGTGLGLSVCRNLVLEMGGVISVESRGLHAGTVATVVLPRSRRAPDASPLHVREGATTRRGLVLVVDDEPAIGIALRRLLTTDDVTAVTRAADALELIRAGHSFDVILSDLMMPEMSGMDFHRELARTFPEAATRIVFISGGAFTPDAAAYMESVPNEQVRKPFDIPSLRLLLRRLIDARR